MRHKSIVPVPTTLSWPMKIKTRMNEVKMHAGHVWKVASRKTLGKHRGVQGEGDE